MTKQLNLLAVLLLWLDEINSLRVGGTYVTLELDSSISSFTLVTDTVVKNKESCVIEVMLLLKWDGFQMGFCISG